jgi:hypothetical protein
MNAKQKLVWDQRLWMDKCGSDLPGYVKTYGAKGRAIYAADLTELVQLTIYAKGQCIPQNKIYPVVVAIIEERHPRPHLFLVPKD